ncbi:NADH:flavin oxidoreductase [Candidatus Atribacteria bacterium HGW-Atribacteria-1]|nr:MAG: NADH:flavin oxidoreductase [Candidatus Atribacteria bacterium HGW-Atribacteria-1]
MSTADFSCREVKMDAKLFSPININRLRLRNRIAIAPMGTNFAKPGGYVSSRLIDHIVRRVSGGCGLVYCEAAYVDPAGIGRDRHLRIYSEEYLPGFREMTDAVHQVGGVIGIQLNHLGREANQNFTKTAPVAPSPIPSPWGGNKPSELSIPEIDVLVKRFATAALNAKNSGFDLIELHAAHGYLLEQFLSPLSNKRRDSYGGSTYNRCKFVLEVIDAVRKVVGLEFPLTLRMSVEEFWEGGLDIQESLKILQILQNAGIDAVSITCGVKGSLEYSIPQSVSPKGCYRELSKQIKQSLRIPIMVAGRIDDALVSTEIVESNDADIVVVGRALLADPDFSVKIQRDESDELRPCIKCNVCIDRLFKDLDIYCSVNPELGHEKDYIFSFSTSRKRVLVVGGGPAGMESARTCALKGHEVSLWEKERTLGGKLLYAAKELYKGALLDLVRWYERQLFRLGVKIVLLKEFNVAEIEAFGADYVILATGSSIIKLAVPIAEEANVYYAEEVLRQDIRLDGTVAIVGGGAIGLELAEMLLVKGADVLVIEKLQSIGIGLETLTKKVLLERLERLYCQIFTDMQVLEIQNSKVIVSHQGKVKELAANAVVMAIGYNSYNVLKEQLDYNRVKFLIVGDCAKVGKIGDAISGASQVCLSI